MHYVTHRSRRMKKHEFGITVCGAPFVETAMGPHLHEK
jgi:hypothetical protein